MLCGQGQVCRPALACGGQESRRLIAVDGVARNEDAAGNTASINGKTLAYQVIWLDNYLVTLINVAAAGMLELAYIQPDHLGTQRVVIEPARDVATWEWSKKIEVFGDQAPSNDLDGDGVAFEVPLAETPAERAQRVCEELG